MMLRSGNLLVASYPSPNKYVGIPFYTPPHPIYVTIKDLNKLKIKDMYELSSMTARISIKILARDQTNVIFTE